MQESAKEITGTAGHPLPEVTISINAAGGRRVSRFLYGMNSMQLTDPGSPMPDTERTRIREAGVTILRLCCGNNATKYNWKKKLSSHPDWYNNVYPNDWDFAARYLEKNFPGVHGMWAFQLSGKVADSADYNFNDRIFNNSRYWEGVTQNLAGYGIPDTTGGKKAIKDGDPGLYLRDWSVDDSVDILDHWFAPGGLGLNEQLHRYWNLDNEPDIWCNTHDDVMPVQPSGEEFMRKYFQLAKKARAKWPAIKLAGPVAANEWQWYSWNGGPVRDGSDSYPWLEYFIRRIADEQERTGIRLLDLLDIHFYPLSQEPGELLQMQRIFFDRGYRFPEAKGVKFVNGDWDEEQGNEYIFERCLEWLERYIGKDHGVTLGVSETGIESNDPNIAAVWYASMMGEFMKNGVELFTPWTWKTGMWETLHLFSCYNLDVFLDCTSSDEMQVSAYPTTNDAQTTLTIILVNRSVDATRRASVSARSYFLPDQQAQLLTISRLPPEETFFSQRENGLASKDLSISDSRIIVDLPPMSVNCIRASCQRT